ncbi:hypothetical protein MTO96_041823 [Rhipicephalus appendiculatus]
MPGCLCRRRRFCYAKRGKARRHELRQLSSAPSEAYGDVLQCPCRHCWPQEPLTEQALFSTIDHMSWQRFYYSDHGMAPPHMALYTSLQAPRIFMDNMDHAQALSSGTPGHRVPEGTSSLEASASLFGTQRPTPSPALSLVSVFVFAFVPLLKFLYKWQRFEPSVQLKRRCPFGSTILHDTLFVNLPSVVQGVLSAAEGHAQHPAHVACRSYFVHLRQMQLFLRGINASAADDRRTGALSCSIHSSLTSYAVSVSSLLATGARY